MEGASELSAEAANDRASACADERPAPSCSSASESESESEAESEAEWGWCSEAKRELGLRLEAALEADEEAPDETETEAG